MEQMEQLLYRNAIGHLRNSKYDIFWRRDWETITELRTPCEKILATPLAP